MSAEIPVGWRAGRLKDLCEGVERRLGAEAKLSVLSVTKRGVIPQSDTYDKEIASDDVSKYRVINPGEFGLAPMALYYGAIGCYRGDEPGIISPAYNVFRHKRGVDPEYLDALIRLPRMIAKYDALSQGGNLDGKRKLTPYEAFETVKVSIPPLAEQRAIGEVLGEMENAIASTKEMVLQLGRSRIEIARSFQGTEEAPNWRLRSIGSLLGKCQYGLSIPLDGEGMVPVLRMPDIDVGRVNIDPNSLKCTDVSAAEIEDCAINKGDILFNRTNSQALVGKTGVVRNAPIEPIVFASYLIRLVVKENINPYWLNAVLNLPRIQERLKALATPGVSQWNINAKTLRRFSIPVPPKGDQDRFAELYEAIEERLEAERRKLAALENTRAALAQEILSGRLRLPQNIVARHRDESGQAA